MEQITIKTYIELASCTEEQKKVIQEGLNACHAFWRAAQGLANYEIEQARPHNRCIYAALAVRDILNKSGVVKAEVYTCGLQIELLDQRTGKAKNTIAVGNPAGYSSQKHWNAHLVVRAGDFLFDPTLAQASRLWNDLPHIGCFKFEAPDWHHVRMNAGTAKTTAIASTLIANSNLEIAYFEIPNTAGFEARSYKTSSNSGAKQRRDVVSAALAILADGSQVNIAEIEAKTVNVSAMGRRMET